MSDDIDLQAKYAFYTVMAGILIIFILILVAMFVFKNAENPGKEISAIMGTITGVLGTLVGYIAGQRGKEHSDQRATKAEEKYVAIASQQGGSELVQKAKELYPDLFK
jgi:hypothetical protein